MKNLKQNIVAIMFAFLGLFSFSLNAQASESLEEVANDAVIVSEPQKDVSGNITMSGNLSVVYQSGESADIIIGNEPIEPPPSIHVRNTLIYDIDWTLPNEIKMNKGDTFSVKIPGDGVTFNFTPKADNNDPTNPDPVKYEEMFMSGQILGFWTIENAPTGSYIRFVAHENLSFLENVNGSFGFSASVDSFDATGKDVSFGFGDNEWIETEIENPGYIPPDAWGRPIGFPNPTPAPEWGPISKGGLFEGYLPNGNGKLEWDIRIGIDDYQKALNNHTFSDFSTGVIIEDNLEGDQYFMYDDLSIWSIFHAPSNVNGDMSDSYRSVDFIRNLPAPLHQTEEQSDADWRASIINSGEFAYGISYDRQTFLCNIGDIGKNGITVHNSNKEFETQLRNEKLSGTGKYAFTEDEIEVMMKSLGFNESGYVLETGNVIDINNQVNGQVLAYNFRLHTEARPGGEYSNTVSIVGTPDNATSLSPVTVLEFEGEIEADYKGKIRIIKIDTETEDVLDGVIFALEREQADGTFAPYMQNGVEVSATTDINGEITFSGLDEGFYRLVETQSAEGYDRESLVLYMQSIPIHGDLEAVDYTTEIDEIEINFIRPHSKEYVLVATNEKINEGLPVIPELDPEEGGPVIDPSVPIIPELDPEEGGPVIEPGLPIIPELDPDEGQVSDPSIPTIPELDPEEQPVIEIPKSDNAANNQEQEASGVLTAPKTGDTSNFALMVLMLTMSLIGVLVAGRRLARSDI